MLDFFQEVGYNSCMEIEKETMLMDASNEIMAILQEECAEVIQAVSKINRFGFESVHNGVDNRSHLEEEVGDLMCMIDLLIDSGVVREGAVMAAKHEKLLKLKQWSSIFKG